MAIRKRGKVGGKASVKAKKRPKRKVGKTKSARSTTYSTAKGSLKARSMGKTRLKRSGRRSRR